MKVPTYLDGKPANLQAAIIDAMYWLRWLRSCLNDQRLPAAEWSEHRARLRLAIRALEEFLPGDDPSGTEATQTLTPAQRAKVNLIKEKLRAKQEAMRAAE